MLKQILNEIFSKRRFYSLLWHISGLIVSFILVSITTGLEALSNIQSFSNYQFVITILLGTILPQITKSVSNFYKTKDVEISILSSSNNNNQ